MGGSRVLRYLGRYTHRVALSNHRLLAFDGEQVTFRWKDYAHGNQERTLTLTAAEFLAAIPAARAASRVRAHPATGVSRRPLPDGPAGLGPQTFGLHPTPGKRLGADGRGHLERSSLWKPRGDRAQSHCPGIGFTMRLLRHFMIPVEPHGPFGAPTRPSALPCSCVRRVILISLSAFPGLLQRHDATRLVAMLNNRHFRRVSWLHPATSLPQNCPSSSIIHPPRQRLPSSLVIESASEPEVPKSPDCVDRGASDER